MKKLFVIILNLIVLYISSCTVQNDTIVPTETAVEENISKKDSIVEVNTPKKPLPPIRTSPGAKVRTLRVPKRPD